MALRLSNDTPSVSPSAIHLPQRGRQGAWYTKKPMPKGTGGCHIIIIMLYIETADTEHFASHREKSAAKQSLFKAFVKRPYSA